MPRCFPLLDSTSSRPVSFGLRCIPCITFSIPVLFLRGESLVKRRRETNKKNIGEISMSSDVCYRCGRPGHWSKDCNAKTTIDMEICHRCGRSGHWESQCYAKSVVNNKGVYVLKNSEGKVYVGQSTDIQRRLEQHKSGEGARWTSEQRGLRRVVPISTEDDESRRGYGRENLETLYQSRTSRDPDALVRGGSFTKRELSERDKAVRDRMMSKEFGRK
jgi:hypothetical protein